MKKVYGFISIVSLVFLASCGGNVVEQAKNTAWSAVDVVSEGVDVVADTATDAASAVVDTAGDAVDTVADTAGDVVEAATDVVEEVVDDLPTDVVSEAEVEVEAETETTVQ